MKVEEKKKNFQALMRNMEHPSQQQGMGLMQPQPQYISEKQQQQQQKLQIGQQQPGNLYDVLHGQDPLQQQQQGMGLMQPQPQYFY